MFTVFVRNWWKHNPAWPNGLEPDPQAKKTILGRVATEMEAQEMCRRYNSSHAPGPLSRKAEYTRG